MRKNLKKLGCAILCTCLLMINTPGSMSYAGSAEAYATDTDAAYADTADTETARTATDTDAVYPVSATDTDALYTMFSDVSEGGYSIEINTQADWDALFNHSGGDGSGWNATGLTATYTGNENPVAIMLNTDITLAGDTTLTFPVIDSVQKDFLLYGNGHSIDISGNKFNLQAANTVAIDNVHFKNGTLNVQGHIGFHCTDSKFSASPVELYAANATERTYITGCKFFDCPGPCVLSKNAPCPVSFSDCTMDNSGLLFKSENLCRVSFSGITAENCTGTVLGQTTNQPYIIESISGCELSTTQTGTTAIKHTAGAVGEITDCTITGFDEGIWLESCSAGPVPDINTATISDIAITDCITGLHTQSFSGYDNVIISNLTMKAREGASGTVGYEGKWGLTTKSFSTVGYDFSQMPQIKSCDISGFDTGINLVSCPAVISDCQISDCKSGISITSEAAAIVDTTLNAGASVAAGSVGVVTNGICWLLDCDINGFHTGSDMHGSSNTTIISCKYQNTNTNLIGATITAVYDTSFIGGETSVHIKGGTSYFYDCVVEGDADVTKSGFSMDAAAYNLYIHSLARPYNQPTGGASYYNEVKDYSDRTVNAGKSEIFNCETGISAKNNVDIADTHIHDCVTGIRASSGNTISHGNNLIEDCRDGMIVNYLNKAGTTTTFTDTFTDTIRNCSNNGLDSPYITSSSGIDPWKNRLEIYNCGNYGIRNTGYLTTAAVDVHDCETGVYIADTSHMTILDAGSKVYNNREWNVYNDSTPNSSFANFIMNGSNGEGTLTEGGKGNIYSKHQATISTTDLYSDDSVYYLGTNDLMHIFSVNNLHGTVVFDTIDTGYTIGRRVAELNADITSQMFAKKEGYVIALEKDASNRMYAVFAAGCDVTYDITTNGGETFSGGGLTRISYLDGSEVDLTYTASRTGYEFVGWNTDKNATEGLDALTAGTTDITLYAIYKKTAYINYHTYDTASDYRTAVTFYNNLDEMECGLDTYNAGGDNTFAGYVLDEDATVSSADDMIAEGGNVTVSPEGLDVYCVYEKQGRLDYLKKDGTVLSTERITVYQIMSDNKKFMYTVKAGEPVAGFTFTGWKDNAGNSYVAGSTLRTEDNFIVLTPIYEEDEEPTTETPTTEEPTTETPTTETPTTEEPTTETPTTETPSTETPTTEAPTTETSTSEAPAAQVTGPKTGDSAAPIGVIGLGFLSLLGILGLFMKNKKKN